jgi:hypothetical protein
MIPHYISGRRIKVLVPSVFCTKITIRIVLGTPDVAARSLSKDSDHSLVLRGKIEGVTLGHDRHLGAQRHEASSNGQRSIYHKPDCWIHVARLVIRPADIEKARVRPGVTSFFARGSAAPLIVTERVGIAIVRRHHGPTNRVHSFPAVDRGLISVARVASCAICQSLYLLVAKPVSGRKCNGSCQSRHPGYRKN